MNVKAAAERGGSRSAATGCGTARRCTERTARHRSGPPGQAQATKRSTRSGSARIYSRSELLDRRSLLTGSASGDTCTQSHTCSLHRLIRLQLARRCTALDRHCAAHLLVNVSLISRRTETKRQLEVVHMDVRTYIKAQRSNSKRMSVNEMSANDGLMRCIYNIFLDLLCILVSAVRLRVAL